MIIDPIKDFVREIPIFGALMGIDLGTKTIGVAVSDQRRTIATGIQTIKRTKFQQDLKTLELLIEHREIKGIVIGLPKNMNGTEGRRCQSTRAFAKNLSITITIPITFWDERLSTIAAERSLIAANTSRQRRTEVIDYVAASFILQGALDRLTTLRES
tara:strand:+ start:1255 stop:1728 length:474 start_codon:yes stop_codon:yes gene_type:complete